MEIPLRIPIKPYLKKYIEVSFGERIVLSEKTWLGIIVLNLLKKKSFKNNYEDRFIIHKENLNVYISMDKMYRNGCFLTNTQIFYINSAIDDFFKKEIIRQCLINEKIYQINFKTSIYNFLEAHDITEEELNYETIKRYFNRNYKKLEKRMIF